MCFVITLVLCRNIYTQKSVQIWGQKLQYVQNTNTLHYYTSAICNLLFCSDNKKVTDWVYQPALLRLPTYVRVHSADAPLDRLDR